MRFIICGAGRVGRNLASYLASDGHDIVVIGPNKSDLNELSALDIQIIHGPSSSPELLEQAGAHKADVIMAVTQSDEVNMVICQMAYSLFNMPLKMARIRSQMYLDPLWSDLFSRDHLPVDVIISPEYQIARDIEKRLRIPGVVESFSFLDDKLKMVGIYALPTCPLLNTPLRHLTKIEPDLQCKIIALVRQGKAWCPQENESFQAGDYVYLTTPTEQLSPTLEAFGYSIPPSPEKIVVAGGGRIAQQLGLLCAENGYHATFIDNDTHAAQRLAKSLPQSVVLRGDILNRSVLAESRIENADVFISITNDDRTNLLASLLAHNQGCPRVMTLLNDPFYDTLALQWGGDTLIHPQMITASFVLRYIRHGAFESVYSVKDGFGEIMAATTIESTPFINKPLGAVTLPAGITVAAVLRDGNILTPSSKTVIMAGERVVCFVMRSCIHTFERYFMKPAAYN
jgi:trk system potassium uptake protein TrkA